MRKKTGWGILGLFGTKLINVSTRAATKNEKIEGKLKKNPKQKILSGPICESSKQKVSFKISTFENLKKIVDCCILTSSSPSSAAARLGNETYFFPQKNPLKTEKNLDLFQD